MLFAVRLWREEVGGASEYRGSARDVISGAFCSFRAWPGGTCSPGVVDGSGGPGAFEAFSRGAASRERTQAMKTGSFRTGFDWSIVAPALFPRVLVSVQVWPRIICPPERKVSTSLPVHRMTSPPPCSRRGHDAPLVAARETRWRPASPIRWALRCARGQTRQGARERLRASGRDEDPADAVHDDLGHQTVAARQRSAGRRHRLQRAARAT